MKRITDFDEESKSIKKQSIFTFAEGLSSIPCDDIPLRVDAYLWNYCNYLRKLLKNDLEAHLNTYYGDRFLQIREGMKEDLIWTSIFHNDPMKDGEGCIKLKRVKTERQQRWLPTLKGFEMHHYIPLRTQEILSDVAKLIIDHYVQLCNKHSLSYQNKLLFTICNVGVVRNHSFSGGYFITSWLRIGLPKTWSDYMILNRMLKQ